jgi:hypothetical protein
LSHCIPRSSGVSGGPLVSSHRPIPDKSS